MPTTAPRRTLDGTTHFYYTGSSLVETRSGTDRLLQQFVHGIAYPDELVALLTTSDPPNQTSCDTLCYYQQDASFNVLGLTDAGGTLVEHYEYAAKGQRQVFVSAGANDPAGFTPQLLSQSSNTLGTALNAFGYQGLYHDAETGLIYRILNLKAYLDCRVKKG